MYFCTRFRHFLSAYSDSSCIAKYLIRSKNTRAGVVRPSKDRSVALSYERAIKPHMIGVHKSWNSWNTANLHGESLNTAKITWQDAFIRLFINGTFPTIVMSERHANFVTICFLLVNDRKPKEVYFLVGYSEEMLSAILRCPVKLEINVVPSRSDVVFKHV